MAAIGVRRFEYILLPFVEMRSDRGIGDALPSVTVGKQFSDVV